MILLKYLKSIPPSKDPFQNVDNNHNFDVFLILYPFSEVLNFRILLVSTSQVDQEIVGDLSQSLFLALFGQQNLLSLIKSPDGDIQKFGNYQPEDIKYCVFIVSERSLPQVTLVFVDISAAFVGIVSVGLALVVSAAWVISRTDHHIPVLPQRSSAGSYVAECLDRRRFLFP